jgi:hypothetical protein
MDKKPILEGDLVTVELNQFQAVSNTYRVLKKLQDICILSHPLAADCLIMKLDHELNNTFPSTRSPLEKCLYYAKNNKEYLGYTMTEDLEALCYYFVIRRQFTPKQRNDLANICGKIASVVLGNSISAAISGIKQNKALLDEYNHSLYENVKKVVESPLTPKSKGERYTIFNIAGFLLAQMSNY